MKLTGYIIIISTLLLYTCQQEKNTEGPEYLPKVSKEKTTDEVVIIDTLTQKEGEINNDTIIKQQDQKKSHIKREEKNDAPKAYPPGKTFTSPSRYPVGSDAWKNAMKRDSLYIIQVDSMISIHGEKWAENHWNGNIQRVYREYIKK